MELRAPEDRFLPTRARQREILPRLEAIVLRASSMKLNKNDNDDASPPVIRADVRNSHQ